MSAGTPLAATLDDWDRWLFDAIHPLVPPSTAMLRLAEALAEGPLLLCAGLLGFMLGWARLRMRADARAAAVFAAAALLANKLIGLAWARPRPFAAEVGQAWMTHAATASFPSNHLTLQWVVAGILLLDRRTRLVGAAIALLGLPMAWARVYLGVHYPGDMLGGLAMGALAALGGRLVLPRPPAATDV